MTTNGEETGDKQVKYTFPSLQMPCFSSTPWIIDDGVIDG